MLRTAEQESIVAAARDLPTNLSVNALAGTGKTTTLEMIEGAVPTKPILYLCFNRDVAKEAEKRMATTTTVRTFNSLGHRIWAHGRKISFNPKKTQDILRALIDEIPKREQGPVWDSFWPVVQGVGLAKSLGYLPVGKYTQYKGLCTQSTFHAAMDEAPDDLCSDLIETVLTRSIAASLAGSIDYNDQVYMPAIFGGTFPRFPLVLVDEAQDLNPVNHAVLDRLVKHRVILVGDPQQSIYGFRGSVQAGMATLASKFATTPLDLSISFRCPEEIVKAVHWRVPNFKWMKPGGHVDTLDELTPAEIPEDSTFICRNNAPLFANAIKLLSAGRATAVAGSEIGPKLIALLRKLGPESTPRDSVLGLIAEWEAEKLAKGSTTAADMAASMRVFAEVGTDLAQAISYAEHVLAQKGSIRLMTGHKAKGLEFDVVFHLDPWLCREDEQDLNLRYVITTRSKDEYYNIDSARIKW